MSIEGIAYALPSVKQTATDIGLMTGADPDFISNKVGLKTRFVLGPSESGVSLSTSACEKLFESYPHLCGNVDLLVCVTQSPDRQIPHNSPGIAHALGLPSTTATFDINLGCSGYIYGIQIVESFLKSCGMMNAILITCDPYSRIIAGEDRDTNCIFGDAATATWISIQGQRSCILATDFGTDGSGSDAIFVTAGGVLHPLISMKGGNAETLYDRNDLRLHMVGRAVFNFVLRRVPISVNICVSKSGESLHAIDYFALHQGSSYMLDALAKHAGWPAHKILKNINSYGNTVSSSIPLLLAELDEAGMLSNKLVAMSGFGVGLSWASAIIRFNS